MRFGDGALPRKRLGGRSLRTNATARSATTGATAGLWGRDAGMIAAHTRVIIDHFEIINEPDGRWAFLGSPQQYARVLHALV